MRVAAVQLNSTAEKAANLAAADRLVRAAAADGARLIVLPEKWSVLGSDEDLRAGAETLEGPTVLWARGLARELQIDLVAGSIVELRKDRERLANTSVHVDPHGQVRAVYRKLHMFDVEVEGRSYRESAVTEPGEELVLSVVADDDNVGGLDVGAAGGVDAGGVGGLDVGAAGGVELGMSICYDLRFPELYRILALRGARVFPLPAAFTLPTTRDHWDTLLRARAIDNQAFVIAANQVGEHPGGHHSGGRSMIVDPWGVVLACAEGGEGFVAADCDLAGQEEIRARFPALANRRPEVYRWPGQVEAPV